MLRVDLKAAGIPDTVETEDGKAYIDFHSFRGLRVTECVRTGAPHAVIQEICRLSSPALLDKYTKLAASDLNACISKISMPKLK